MRTLYNLVPGAPATVSFAWAMRNAPPAGWTPSTLVLGGTGVYGPPAGQGGTGVGPLWVYYNGTLVGSTTGQPNGAPPWWSYISFTFTPAVASGMLQINFTVASGQETAGFSINIDNLVVNQRCPAGMFSEVMSGSCLPCSANTLSASGCVESWEGAGVVGPAAVVAPSYNSWSWSACAVGGVSGPTQVTAGVPILNGTGGSLSNA